MKKSITIYIPIIFLIFSISQILNYKSFHVFAQWTKPQKISSDNIFSLSNYDFEIFENKRLLFVFSAALEASLMPTHNIYFREMKNDIPSGTGCVYKSEYNSEKPVIIKDKEGVIHLVWGIRLETLNRYWVDKPTDVFYSFYKNGIWSEPVSLFHLNMNKNNDAFIKGKLFIDKNNRLHAFWSAKDTAGTHIYHRIKTDTTWSEIRKIFTISSMGDFDIYLENHQIFHLGYSSINSLRVASLFYTASSDIAETWLNSHRQVNASIRSNDDVFSIISDGEGNLHFYYIVRTQWTVNNIGDVYSPDGINWTLSGNKDSNYINTYYKIAACLDKNKKPHLFYMVSTTSTALNLIHSSINNSQIYPGDTVIKNIYYPMRVKVDDENQFHILIMIQDSTSNLYYVRSKTSSDGVEKDNPLVRKNMMYQNFPNPFNPHTNISYMLTKSSNVRIIIYDYLGRIVKILVDKYDNPGQYTVMWKPENLPGGVYYYKIETNEYRAIKKAIYLK